MSSTAYYSQAYTYDAQGRLSSAALGSYTYGDPNHPYAVTNIGSGAYSASYDAAGDMTCRAPSSSATCSGVPTGATLTYDAERRLAGWQNQPSSPTVEAAYLYDGEGNRIEQWVSTSGVQTTTGYLLGGTEERANTGTLTVYLGAKGLPTGIRVGAGGSLNYLAIDGLGSVSVAVDGSGNVVASQLFAPYGTVRYSNGTMPTSRGFTGQRADATSGLDYYNARYYDPVAGQFTSADDPLYGLSRYTYVEGAPETMTDPGGHCPWCVAILGGAAVGAAVGILAGAISLGVDYHNTGKITGGQVGRALADVALGAGAGAAIGASSLGDPGGAVGAGAAAVGVFAGLVAAPSQFNGEAAFESIAIGAISGAVSDGASDATASFGGDAITFGASIARITFGPLLQAGIASTFDLLGQYVGNLGSGHAFHPNVAETVLVGYFAGVGGFLDAFALNNALIRGVSKEGIETLKETSNIVTDINTSLASSICGVSCGNPGSGGSGSGSSGSGGSGGNGNPIGGGGNPRPCGLMALCPIPYPN